MSEFHSKKIEKCLWPNESCVAMRFLVWCECLSNINHPFLSSINLKVKDETHGCKILAPMNPPSCSNFSENEID